MGDKAEIKVPFPYLLVRTDSGQVAVARGQGTGGDCDHGDVTYDREFIPGMTDYETPETALEALNTTRAEGRLK